MTQEDKYLLLRDLSARLPYGVKIACGPYDKNPRNVNSISIVDIGTFLNGYFTKGIQLNFNGKKELWPKPYLRPMSSMTDEECKYCVEHFGIQSTLLIGAQKGMIMPMEASPMFIDWLNAHHFDYRGLIEKGLALEATKDMYKI